MLGGNLLDPLVVVVDLLRQGLNDAEDTFEVRQELFGDTALATLEKLIAGCMRQPYPKAFHHTA